jgi:hypothetical protein
VDSPGTQRQRRQHHGSARQGDQRGAEPGRHGGPPGVAAQPGVGRAQPGQPVLDRAVGGQVGQPVHQLDRLRAQVGPQRGQRPRGPTGEDVLHRRRHQQHHQQPGHHPRAEGRQQPGEKGRGGRPGEHDRGDREPEPGQHVHRRVHIGPELLQQHARPGRGETGRPQVHQPPVQADPQLGPDPQRRVVPGHALGVAEDPLAESERAHADDRDRQRQHRRLLGGP